jgi:hypothetical protein
VGSLNDLRRSSGIGFIDPQQNSPELEVKTDVCVEDIGPVLGDFGSKCTFLYLQQTRRRPDRPAHLIEVFEKIVQWPFPR